VAQAIKTARFPSPSPPSRKHLATGGRELHISPALMPHQPALGDRAGQGGTIEMSGALS
jgi:hypothetical protein